MLKKLGMARNNWQEQVCWLHLDLNGIASKVEIAGPGLINIFLDPAFAAKHVRRRWRPIVLGVATLEKRPLS
ncbi:hypothetical protein ACNKHU_11335 [Shigella flexneri]